MEDKKSMFASSLIQNVLSKKIQFEQERRMERGEISEPRQRQTSRTECALMRVHEPADCVYEESCSDSPTRDGPDLEPQNEAGVSAKSDAMETSRSALLRSQNSAFRSFKDQESGSLQNSAFRSFKDQESGSLQNSAFRSWKDQDSGSAGGTWTDGNTKTSHLYVPSVQAMDGYKRRSDVTNIRSLTSKSPEIKINLRSVKGEPSRGRTDQVLAATLKGESADKVPHFIIRDIRDSKGKLQTPIHQVRDIRKLVKSSYHFVSLDNGEHKSHSSSADIHKMQRHDRNLTSGSLIVIKCQSVNTSSAGTQPGNVEFTKHDPSDTHEERCPQGGRPGASEEGIAVKTASNRKQEKISEIPEKITNQVALEKLQAAVKTMEQLYVFQKNEWRRKTDDLSPSGGGKLAIKAREEMDCPKRQVNLDRMVRGVTCSMEETTPESRLSQVLQTSSSSSNPQDSSIAHTLHPNTNRLVPESSTTPSQTRQSGINSNGIESQGVERLEDQFLSSSADSENYLSIPVKSHPHISKTGQSAAKTLSLTPQPGSTSPLTHDRWRSRGPEDPTSSLKYDKFTSRGPEDLTSPLTHDRWRSMGPEDSTSSLKYDRWTSMGPEDSTSLAKHEELSSRGMEDLTSPLKYDKWSFRGPENPTSPSKHDRWGSIDSEDPTSLAKHKELSSRGPEEPTNPLKHNRLCSISSEDPTSLTKHKGSSPRGLEDPTSPLRHNGLSFRGPEDPTSPLKHDRWSSRCPDDSSSPPKHYEWSSRGLEDHSQQIRCSSMVMETHPQEVPRATNHHPLPLGMASSQAQVYCFSPAVTPAPTMDPFQATQRKMLLDPTTGNYYLVDTPVPPATKCLFDPETGQYVEVPLSQPPMAPVSVPPMALTPAAFGHTYMIYPGFMPTPSVIPARALVRSQRSAPLKEDGTEDASSQHAEGLYMDSPFYMTTGRSPRVVAHQAATGQFQDGFNTPLISIASQQRPRIVAPPLFDGTTMSFVVEHR